MKRSRKMKRVSWARGSNLCQVKFFKSEDPPSKVGNKSNKFDDFPPGFERVFQNQQRVKPFNTPQIRWKRPPSFALRAEWKVAAGEESKEKCTEMLREKRVLAGDYRRISAITPRSSISFDVEKESYDDNLTPLIPIEKKEESRKDIDPHVAIKELVASGADVGTAAAIAAAIAENNIQGSLINLNLLPEIVSDPTIIEKIIEAYNNNVITVRSPEVVPSKTTPPTSSMGLLSTLATTTVTSFNPLSGPLPSISSTMAVPSTSVIMHGEKAKQGGSTIPRIVKTTPPTSSILATTTATSSTPLSKPVASISSTMTVPSPSVIMHGKKAKRGRSTIPRIVKTTPPTSSILATTTATSSTPLSKTVASISPTMAVPLPSVIMHGKKAKRGRSTIPRIVKTTPPTSSILATTTATSSTPLSKPVASISSTMAVPSPSVIMHGEKAKRGRSTIPRIVKTTPPTSSILATTTATSSTPLSKPVASISSTMAVPPPSVIMHGKKAKRGRSTIPRIVKTTPPTSSILATTTAPSSTPLSKPLASIASTMAVPSPSVIMHGGKAKQVGSTNPRTVKTTPPTSSIGLLSTLATTTATPFIPLSMPLAWPLAPISSTMAVLSPSVIMHGEIAKQVGSTNIPRIVKTTPPTSSIGLLSTLATTTATPFIPLSRPLASSTMAVPSPSVIMHGENAKQMGSTIPRIVKDPNYYKQLIKKHGTDKRELQIYQNNLQDLKRQRIIINPGGLHGSDCFYQHIAQSEVDNAAKHDEVWRM